MKHELRRETLLLCRPERWEARAQIVDAWAGPAARRPQPRADMGDEENGDPEIGDTDIWGDPIPRMKIAGGIAVVPVRGLISEGMPTVFECFGYVNLANVRRDLMTAALDPEVKAIALDMDSPGGGLRGVPETAAMVAGLGKDVWCLAGDCCSAAYYVAAASRGILATPSAELGAIGVFANIPTDRGFWDKVGVKWNMIKSGKFKGMAADGQDLSEDQTAEIQKRVDMLGANFRAHVSAWRSGVSPENMQGQSFLGDEARAAGFCDDIIPDLGAALDSISALYTI